VRGPGAVLALLLVFAVPAAPLAARAQPTGKIYRIGYLADGGLSGDFVQGLHELGWVVGTNIEIEGRYSEGRYERLPDLAAELVRLGVDVLVASTAPGTLAAKEATTTIPIVSVAVQDPVRLGLVQSLGRPGGNITGPTLTGGLAIAGKQLELLQETVPGVSRVAVLWNPANPMLLPHLRETEVASRSLKVQLHRVEARGPDDIDRAFSAMTRDRARALLVAIDSMFFTHRTRLADLAVRHRVPAIYGLRGHAEAGGLMAYGARVSDVYRRAATYVDKILKGAKPGDLPMEQPTRFDLVVNLKAAKALGLTIPQSVLLRADVVIE
jgi:putative ABC transport system substrate-binding protein